MYVYPVDDTEMRRLIARERDPDLRQAYVEMLEGCIDEPLNRVWHTVWYMELKDSPSTVVGDLSFKGLRQDGMVEIGYGLRPGHCGKGYMTEAVSALVAWALDQPGVSRVEAETDPDNEASQRVLTRAGFVPKGETGKEGPRFVFVGP